MGDIYNNSEYLANNPNWHQEDSAVKAANIVKILQKNNIQFSSLAEIGCGTGEILIELKKQLNSADLKFFGFDISKDAVRLAEQKNSGIVIECKDITRDPSFEKKDVILVIDVLEHLRDYFTFLEDIRNKASYTVFHIPLDMFVWSLFREQMLIESKKRVGHIHNFTEEFIVSVLHDHGYTVLDRFYTEPDYKADSFKQKMVNAMKKFLFKVSPRFCVKTLGGFSLMVLCENSNALRSR